ncbi:MAG TPA: Gfo/Idh/MocA family oxidoreductase [Candidatus Didemnitutus sp.]|nr:Gfo/Idh/MocA family oxidoreductase [Candidatus Didemnitutus sp.]
MSVSVQRPRLALIGLSGYGRIHLQLARECRDRGEVDIVAAAVINPDEERENIAELRARGCEIFSGYPEMLERCRGKIDLCLIPTGIHWHARMTIDALRAGANVLVEKPLAGSSAEVEAVRAAERESGRFVAVGFQDFYEPATAWLKSELLRGAIGQIESVRFLGLWPRNKTYFTRNDWAGRLQAGGTPVLDSPLNNAFAHFVMLSLYFAGPAGKAASLVGPEQVELFRAHAIESFDTGVVSGRTPEGVRLWFGASHACRETVEPEIVIQGTTGTAYWRYENEAGWRDASGREQRRAMPDTTATRRSMMAAVLRRLRDPSAPICGSAMAGCHTALIEAAHRASPITPFPAGWVSWQAADGSSSGVPDVRGLNASLRQAFAGQKTLHDCGFLLAPGAAAR